MACYCGLCMSDDQLTVLASSSQDQRDILRTLAEKKEQIERDAEKQRRGRRYEDRPSAHKK